MVVLHLTHSGSQEGKVCSHVKIDTSYFRVISGSCRVFGCNFIDYFLYTYVKVSFRLGYHFIKPVLYTLK